MMHGAYNVKLVSYLFYVNIMNVSLSETHSLIWLHISVSIRSPDSHSSSAPKKKKNCYENKIMWMEIYPPGRAETESQWLHKAVRDISLQTKPNKLSVLILSVTCKCPRCILSYSVEGILNFALS